MKCDENDPGLEVWLTFVESGYKMGGYISTIRDVQSGKDSSVSGSNVRKQFKKYLLRSALGHLARKETVSLSCFWCGGE